MRTALSRRLARPSALRVLRHLITQDDLQIVASTTFNCQSVFLRRRTRHSDALDSAEKGKAIDDVTSNRSSSFNGVRFKSSTGRPYLKINEQRYSIRRYPSSSKLPPTQTIKDAGAGSLSAPRPQEQHTFDQGSRQCKRLEPSPNPISTEPVANIGVVNLETARPSRIDTFSINSHKKERFESPHVDKWSFRARRVQSSKGATVEDRHSRIRQEYNNFDSHLRRLQFSQRVHGERGVYEDWKRMMKFRIDLPVVGKEADALWTWYLTQDEFLEEVISYALDLKARTDLYFEQLYFTVVKHKLINSPEELRHWHQKLWLPFSPPAGTMNRLASIATRSRASLKQFKEIYVISKQRDIYNTIITELLNKREYYVALEWHNFLIRQRDLPTKPSNEAPRWRSIGSKVSEDLEANSLELDPILRRPRRFDRAVMYNMIGHEQKNEPERFSDHFCARLFATKAFSTDLIINGLNMFSVEEIGPLALRELAARAGTPEKVLDKFEMLSNAGINPRQSVFAQAVHRFAKDNRKEWLDWLLTTDIHPDSFEDKAKQNEFLYHYIRQRNWVAVQRTLAILTLYHGNPKTLQWNKLLRAVAVSKDFPMLRKLVENMRLYRVQVTESSMATIQKHVLRSRRRSHAPVTREEHRFDDLVFVTNIWRYIVESGGPFDLRRWREIFRRYGMALRWREAARLANWLVTWYSPGQSRRAYAANLQSSQTRLLSIEETAAVSDVATHHPKHPLRMIFDMAQQGSIIAWGFQFGLRYRHRALNSPRGWSRGLALLKTLRERGVYVSTVFVQRKLKQNLLALYGHNHRRFWVRKWGSGFSNRRHVRWMRSFVANDMDTMIEQANEIWGMPLLKLPLQNACERPRTRVNARPKEPLVAPVPISPQARRARKRRSWNRI